MVASDGKVVDWRKKLSGRDISFLAFLQEQMEDRKSPDFPDKLGRTPRDAVEYMVLSMVWNEFLNHKADLFPTLNSEEMKSIWLQVAKLRKVAEAIRNDGE